MNKRAKAITAFICSNYCQTCDNSNCNVEQIMEKYQDNWLTPTLMAEVNEFQLDKVSCKNHIPNEGYTMFGYKIEVHHMDGRVEKKKGWDSPKAISEMWSDDVEYVVIQFTDI